MGLSLVFYRNPVEPTSPTLLRSFELTGFATNIKKYLLTGESHGVLPNAPGTSSVCSGSRADDIFTGAKILRT